VTNLIYTLGNEDKQEKWRRRSNTTKQC